MPFSGNTFTKLYEWLKDPQRNEKIFNSRLDDEFGGIATGLTTLGDGVVNVKMHGAVGDGVTDDYTAIFNAVEAAKAIGANVYVPPGNYLINMSGVRPSIFLDSMHFYGAGNPQYQVPGSLDHGTWFFITGTSASPFTMYQDVSFTDCTFLYPDQVDPASPTTYPATIGPGVVVGSIIISFIQRLTFINSFIAIDLGTNNGYNTITDNHIGALYQGIIAGASFAETYITDNFIDYGPGYQWFNALGKLSDLITRSADVVYGIILTSQCDAWRIDANVFFGLLVAIGGDKATEGYYWGTINDNNIDGCGVGISFANKFRPVNVTVSGNTFNNQGNVVANQAHILFNMTGASEYFVSIAGNNFAASPGGHIAVYASDASQKGTVAITGNNFCRHGYGVPGTWHSTLIVGDALDVTYTGNNCDGAGLASTYGLTISTAKTVTVTGNYFRDLTGGVLNAGTIGGNLVVVGNNENGTTTEVTVGTVTGTTIQNLNSWNTTLIPLASTTSYAAMNFIDGAAPSAPNDGDVWREDNTNTGFKIRVNGVTKTITLS